MLQILRNSILEHGSLFTVHVNSFFYKKNSAKSLVFFHEKPVQLIDFTRIVHEQREREQ